jgi:hypothetical protein
LQAAVEIAPRAGLSLDDVLKMTEAELIRFVHGLGPLPPWAKRDPRMREARDRATSEMTERLHAELEAARYGLRHQAAQPTAVSNTVNISGPSHGMAFQVGNISSVQNALIGVDARETASATLAELRRLLVPEAADNPHAASALEVIEELEPELAKPEPQPGVIRMAQKLLGSAIKKAVEQTAVEQTRVGLNLIWEQASKALARLVTDGATDVVG